MTLKEIYDLKKEDATNEYLKTIGWTKIYENPQELKRRTFSYLSMIKENIKKDNLEKSHLWNQIQFEGQNKRDREFGKSFERLFFYDTKSSCTVICNMSGSGAKYLVFQNRSATPAAKCRSFREVCRFLIRELAA